MKLWQPKSFSLQPAKPETETAGVAESNGWRRRQPAQPSAGEMAIGLLLAKAKRSCERKYLKEANG
jgi:hypothetical protein